MAKIRRMKRKRGGSKRLDLAPLRELLKDRRCWTCAALVVIPDGESSHYEILTQGGQQDVLVEVETIPEQVPLTCRLAGTDVWRVPGVGEEVAVVVPAGELSFMPIIVATMSSGTVPDGVGAGVTVIANSQVVIHDGAGGASELVTMAEFRGHGHQSGTGPTAPTTDPIAGVGLITGTTVLRAK